MVKMEEIKVGFLHPDLGIGGAERLVLDVAVALKNQGVKVEFVTNHFDKEHAFEELKTGEFPVKVVGDWLPRGIFGAFQALCAYVRMLYLAITFCLFCKKDKPNLYFVDQIPMAVPIIKMTGCPVIYYCHHPDLLASPPGGVLKRLYRLVIDWVEKYGTDKADMILVNSTYTSEVFRDTFPAIKQDLIVLYPSISTAFQDDISKAVKKPIHELAPEITVGKPDDVVFLSINRFHPAKQLTLAIEAMSELRKKLSKEEYNRVHLIMAGGYDPLSDVNHTYFKKLVELTHARDLIVKVTFLKSPSDKVKAELLKSCDCLLYTPTNEHFGIVPLEAMAAAKPVIACNSGGPRETIEHNVTGYLCEPTPASLSKFMAKLLDKGVGEQLGQQGLTRMKDLFSNKAFSNNCMRIIQNMYTSSSKEKIM